MNGSSISVVSVVWVYYFAGALPFRLATFGSGSGSIWLDTVSCNGSEARLLDCPADPVGSHNCGHSEDAGVQCQDIGIDIGAYMNRTNDHGHNYFRFWR